MHGVSITRYHICASCVLGTLFVYCGLQALHRALCIGLNVSVYREPDVVLHVYSVGGKGVRHEQWREADARGERRDMGERDADRGGRQRQGRQWNTCRAPCMVGGECMPSAFDLLSESFTYICEYEHDRASQCTRVCGYMRV